MQVSGAVEAVTIPRHFCDFDHILTRIGRLYIEFDLAAAMALLPHRTVTLTKRSPVDVLALRQEALPVRIVAKQTGHAFFKAQWLKAFGSLKSEDIDRPNAEDQWQHYDTHHRMPLSFGGTNRLENFVMMHPLIHRAVHDEIDQANQKDDDWRVPHCLHSVPAGTGVDTAGRSAPAISLQQLDQLKARVIQYPATAAVPVATVPQAISATVTTLDQPFSVAWLVRSYAP